MRARPNLSGEQIVTDYMTRVAQAARLLPKGARMAFVGRTRALVERELGPPGTRTDPEHVSAVLARLGKPEDLVLEERTRIDQGWVKRRAASREEGEAAAAALSGPRMNRPLTARRRPNTDSQPLTGRLIPPGESETITGPDGSVIGAPAPPPGAGPRRSVLRGANPRNSGARPTGLRGTGAGSAGTPSGDARTSSPRRLRSADAPEQAAHGTVPPGTVPPGTVPPGTVPPGTGQRSVGRRSAGAGEAGHTGAIERLIGQVPGIRGAEGAETFTTNAGRLARENLLESVAILLLGLGGLILPFPFWPIGSIVALFSRLWDIKDKSIAVIGPLLVTLALSVIAAPFVGGSGNVIVVYFHALGVSFGLLVRVGSVITAAYLAWRVSKGPRVKVPPWRRITR
jgi:hypothetical protein